ncbi:MAG: hypothetical protein L3J54_06450 [Draconibacterium sp.]|nr:hypothetical protein [Draconibacterium sp.]
MKKLMYKIMLTCKQATFYSSVKSFKKLKLVHRIQLKLHLSMCKSCHEFDHQNQIIDKSMTDFYKGKHLHSEETLSEEKKSQIKITVNQYIKG